MGSMCALYKLVKTKNKISHLVSLTLLKNVFAKSREEEIGIILMVGLGRLQWHSRTTLLPNLLLLSKRLKVLQTT